MAISTEEQKQAFINKWAPKAIRNQICPGYWSMTPCRVYWALIFDTVTGWDQVTMAEELLRLYEDEEYSNSSLQHARTLVCSTR